MLINSGELRQQFLDVLQMPGADRTMLYQDSGALMAVNSQNQSARRSMYDHCYLIIELSSIFTSSGEDVRGAV